MAQGRCTPIISRPISWTGEGQDHRTSNRLCTLRALCHGIRCTITEKYNTVNVDQLVQGSNRPPRLLLIRSQVSHMKQLVWRILHRVDSGISMPATGMMLVTGRRDHFGQLQRSLEEPPLHGPIGYSCHITHDSIPLESTAAYCVWKDEGTGSGRASERAMLALRRA